MQTVVGRRGAPAKRGPKPERKTPGRPEGGTTKIRQDILNAAERMFSNLGYAGTTLREVSEAANVTQALISYYFGSKFGLFGEVFLRRATKISDERMQRLAALNATAPLDLTEIVRAFLLPTLKLRNSIQGRAFLRLQARLHTEPRNISYELRKSAYDESTIAYSKAIKACLPNLSAADVHWRMTLMIGTYLYAFSDTHRMEDLAPAGNYDPKDSDTLIEQVTRFVVQGMK